MEASTSQMYWTIGAIVMAAVVILALVTWLPFVTKSIATYMNGLVDSTGKTVSDQTTNSLNQAIQNGQPGASH